MKAAIWITSVFIFTEMAMAGGDHFHPKKVAKCSGECTQEQIKGAVPDAITHLNKWNRIDASWAKAKVEGIEKKQFKKGPEWVATLVDSKPESGKRYVFFTLDGYVTGANATGE